MIDGHNTDTNQKVPPDWRGIARELATALIIVSDEAELLLGFTRNNGLATGRVLQNEIVKARAIIAAYGQAVIG